MTNTENLHTEHEVWLNNLEFYKEDLVILRNRLDEVASKNTGHDVMAQVEHFQNQFIIQRNEIDEFRHAIKEHENKVEASAENNQEKLEDHPAMRERMERFEELFHEFRVDLMHFAAKYM